MDLMSTGWFSERNDLWPGVSLSLEVDKVLHKEASEFQDILVVDTKAKGRTLILDGIIQCTENDEFSYQEMISFLPLNCHPCPKNVLIVGGGDGGVAREVAKHKLVESITQVEIDGKVIELSKKYLPFMAKGFQSEKLKVHIGDGFQFMKNHCNEFDLVITDSSDPVGPAVSLFEENYFALIKKALKPNGIMCSQAGTIWSNIDVVQKTLKHVCNLFPVYDYGVCSVPTYPDGQIGFALGSLNVETNFKEPIHLFSEKDLDDMELRYYTSEVHRSAFALPRFASKALKTVTHQNGDSKNVAENVRRLSRPLRKVGTLLVLPHWNEMDMLEITVSSLVTFQRGETKSLPPCRKERDKGIGLTTKSISRTWFSFFWEHGGTKNVPSLSRPLWHGSTFSSSPLEYNPQAVVSIFNAI